MAWLSQLENSGVGVWVRESGSVWSYGAMLFFHTVGLALLAGLSVAIDLRLLGVARRLPVAPMDPFYRIMWMGFWVNAASGAALLIANATTRPLNPLFAVKMGFVTAAVIVMAVIRRRCHEENPERAVPASDRILAVMSMVCWLGAVAAGRLMTYLG